MLRDAATVLTLEVESTPLGAVLLLEGDIVERAAQNNLTDGFKDQKMGTETLGRKQGRACDDDVCSVDQSLREFEVVVTQFVVEDGRVDVESLGQVFEEVAGAYVGQGVTELFAHTLYHVK